MLGSGSDDPLAVGLYCPAWPLESFHNGIVSYAAALAPALRGLGHRVFVLAGRVAEGVDDPWVRDLRDEGSNPLSARALEALRFRVSGRGAPDAARRRLVRTARRVASAERLDLLEMEESFGWGEAVRSSLSVPVVIRLHGPWFLNGPATGVPQDRAYHGRVRDEGRAIARAAAVSAPSQDVLDRVRGQYGLALPDAVVIPNPAPAVPARERWRVDSCDPVRLLFVGRFDRHKGGDLALEAHRLVLQEFPRATLDFVGPDRGLVADDGRTWSLEDFVRERLPGSLEAGSVRWLGAQPFSALPSLRRRAFLTVASSRYENFPSAVSEAMAFGCPLVAARVGGIPEFVEDGVNGLLHEPGDARDLARRIVDLLRDPARASRLGERAALDCERLLSPHAVALRTAAFHRRVVAARRC